MFPSTQRYLNNKRKGSCPLLPLSLPLVSLCLSLAYCSEVMQVHCSWPLLLLLLDEATIDLDLEGEAGVERELCLVLLRIRE